EYFSIGAGPTPAGDLYALGATLFKLKHGVMHRPVIPVGYPGTASSSRPTLEIDSLDSLLTLLLESEPHVRPRHADWVARELERLHAQIVPRRTQPPVGSWDTGGFAEQASGVVNVRLESSAPRKPSLRPSASYGVSTPREPCANPPLVGHMDTLG